MSCGDFSDNFSTLPHEVLKHILHKLPYTCLESIRPTCRAFNAAATELLCEELHSIRLRVDKATVKFMKASWLKTEHAGVPALLTYAKRLAKGSGSLVILTGLIRAVDVCSRQLVQHGALPPLPASVLEEILTAVNFATWRNPLVGVNRLRHIYENILAYFTHNNVLDVSDLPPVVMFKTVLDVLQNMPSLATNDRLDQTDQGVCCSFILPSVRVSLQPPDSEPRSDADALLLKLVELSVHVVDSYVLTSQAQGVMGDNPISQHEGYITELQLTVVAPSLQAQNLSSLQQFCQLEPAAFFVTLSGFKFTAPLDLEDIEATEDIQLVYIPT